MRILVISNTTWDNNNSFGNTFSNLFEGMENVEIYNVCCKSGINKNNIVKDAVQMTDKSVLKSFIHPNYDPCLHISNNKSEKNEVVNQETFDKIKTLRFTIFFYIRDLIWCIGKWKKSKTLLNFLDEVKPDLLYLPAYSNVSICRVQELIIHKLKVPVVAHITDDDYGHKVKFYKQPLAWLLETEVRKHLRKILSYCSYIECFAPLMKKKYEKIFRIPCYVISKGIKKENMPKIYFVPSLKKQIELAYTGNLSMGRYEVLYQMGLALDKLNMIQHTILHITSGTVPSADMIKKFSSCKSINFKGSVSLEEVKRIQNAADYLVHVDSFNKTNIKAYKLSFATKIIDCLRTGHPMIAICPKEINTMQVLMNNNLAITIDNLDNITQILEKLFKGRINVSSIQNNVKKYLETECNIDFIQASMRSRMEKVTTNN
jgi:glycosyltransferase involved in cell wall biosynthesis